jgi:hypothetical protein
MRTKRCGSVEAKMDCEHREDTLDDIKESFRYQSGGLGRTKNNGRTPSNQENGDMLCSKRCGGDPIPYQLDNCAQRSKGQDEEESPENDRMGVCNA